MHLTAVEMKRVKGSTGVPYFRESSVRDVYKISLDIQEESVVEAAEEIDVKLTVPVIDSDKSGRNFDREIQTAIQMCLTGEANHIMVMNLTRFGRDLFECLYYTRKLREDGHLLISVDEGVVDIYTPEGKRKAREAFGEAEDYSDKVGSHWRKAIKHNTKQGLVHRNTERWGYKWCLNESCKRVEKCDECIDDKNPRFCKKCPPRPKCRDCRGKPQVQDPEVAPYVRSVILRILNGEGTGTVVREINDRGYRTALGNKFTTTHLLTMIDCGFYAGLMRAPGSSKDENGKATPRTADQCTYLSAAHKALLTPEEWERWVAFRTKRERHEDSNKPKYAESTLVQCECGRKMSATSGGRNDSARWQCYGGQSKSCKNYNGNRAIVSELVLEWLKSIATAEVLKAIEDAARSYLVAANATPLEHLERFEQEHVALLQESENNQRNLNRGLLDEDFYNAERERLKIAIAESERQIALLRPRNLPTFPSAEFFQDMLSRWGELEEADKRAALKRVIWRIVVKKGELQDRSRYTIIPLWEAHLTGLVNQPQMT